MSHDNQTVTNRIKHTSVFAKNELALRCSKPSDCIDHHHETNVSSHSIQLLFRPLPNICPMANMLDSSIPVPFFVAFEYFTLINSSVRYLLSK